LFEENTIWNMSWIVASLLMFVCSIAFYLSVKKLQVLGVDKRLYTLANYAFPTVLFVILSILQGATIWVSAGIVVALFFLRVVFNYVGTIMGYKGMEAAPNAGYSLIIQKSYAAYTLFAAALLYGSELPLVKVAISLFILCCAFLVSVERGKKLTVGNYKWVMYSLIAFFCFGGISLSSKYFANLGIAAAPQLFWVCLMTLIVTGTDTRRLKKKISFELTREEMTYMAILGMAVTGFYYFKLTAEIVAPNLGYVGAINAASNAAYTVIVAKLFGDALSTRKLLAVLGMTVGMMALFWV